MNKYIQNLKPFILIIGIIVILCFISYYKDSGHEEEIKSDIKFRAERMNMIVNYISVKFIGDGEYKCIYDVYDPGTLYSTPNNIHKETIEKWENGSHKFVRDE